MNKYSEVDLMYSLQRVHLNPGDLVFIHSSLLHLGIMEGVSIQDTAANVYRVISEYLGPDGTLVVPTFNFDFAKGLEFDRQNTPSKNMGIFSEYVRRLPESIRSYHPMFSVAAVGRLASKICLRDTLSAFDEEGPFAVMLKEGCKLVFIGASIQSASLVHYVEEQLNVPYRYWKNVEGPYVDQGNRTWRTYKMFARDLDLDPKLELSVLEERLTKEQKLYKFQLGAGTVMQCSFHDFVSVAIDCLSKDPWCLVKMTKKTSM